MSLPRRTQKRSPSSFALPVLLLLVGSLAYVVVCHAGEASSNSNATPPCALVDASGGDAQILDSSRTQTRVIDSGAATRPSVFCGGWVSVDQGWVTLTHRFGYKINVGPHSFVQFQDDTDAVVLYRGQVYVQTGGGMGELRVLTPNARVKATRASVIVLFLPDQESTQLIAVAGNSTLGNRFEEAKNASIQLKAGETSQLDLQLLRVAPAVPKIVAISSLKEKLDELHVTGHEIDRAISVARNRKHEVLVQYEPQRKKDAAEAPSAPTAAGQQMASLPERYVEGSRAPARAPASVAQKPGSSGSAGEENPVLMNVVGGDPEGVKMLHPKASKKGKKNSSQATVEVQDPEAQMIEKREKEEGSEKQRLIEELSKVHAD